MTVDIRKPLKKFIPLMEEARDDGLNEADTVLRLCRFFEEVLGYDGLRDISREAELKGKYVDVCVKIDGRVRLLVEAKAGNVRLRDKHIEQAQSYASRNNYRWVLLTNGIDWYLYHLTFDEGIEYERAFAISLTAEGDLDDAATKLALLHKKSLAKGQLDEYWDMTTALGASSIGRALFHENVLMLIRREIRRDGGVLIDREDLAKALHEMFTPEARENIGPLKVRRRRKATRAKRIVVHPEASAVEPRPIANHGNRIARGA
jgi:hypothetical protein